MWLYNLLDIISTITEMLVFYTMIACFCKKPRFQDRISRMMPPALLMVFVTVSTYLADLGAVKMFGVLVLMVLLVNLFYEIPFHESLVVMEMSFLLMSMLPEAVGVSLMSYIYDGDIMIAMGASSILKWQIYVTVIVFRCLLLAVTYRFLYNFIYHVQPKDVAVLSISFFLAFCVSFASTYGYLNLQVGDTSRLDLITSVFCVYFVVQFLYSKNVSYLREQEQRDKIQITQLQQQFTYYQDKLKDEERVRALYHDLKNHLLVLESRQNTEETRQMAESLRSQIAGYENYMHTGNEFLDIILKDKAVKAREKQIDFSAMVDWGGIDFVEPLDISTIFGNAIDNAIEACEKLAEDQRLITVKAECVRDMLLITIENSTLPEVQPIEGTTKQDHFLHGFGISNIKNAVEKYGGQCSFRQEDGTYRLKILIPIP